MGIIRLVAVALAGTAGLGSLFARISPTHWQLFELMIVVGCAAIISRRLSSSKLSPAKVAVFPRAAWFAGLPADLREIHSKYFHPWDLEHAAQRSAALVTIPTRPVAGTRRSMDQLSEEALTHVFHP